MKNLGVNVYVRLTRAYRSLSRSSSVPKPRYPPNREAYWQLLRERFRELTYRVSCMRYYDLKTIKNLRRFQEDLFHVYFT
ncbi:MAG: hypothetical protein GF311_02970 [Candidatus Lokiarchaeota archaeon]|nr:hypothetical protein [Candidatus Lokiarchaeota archaeon]